MAFLNTHSRTTGPTKNDLFQPMGRNPALFGVFLAFVKDTRDIQRNGRLRAWIPEFGSAPDNEEGWVILNYCSPFAGSTNVDTISEGNIKSFEGTQTSYGLWMVPPDINNQVLCMFINGDPARGIWIGCLYDQYMNNMIPGMAGSTNNYQYPGKYIPVAEYNKWNERVRDPEQVTRPYEATKFKGVGNQGLITDRYRGVSDSSARREAPSKVFGIITPGPAIDETASPENIRRKGGSALIMDDATGSESVVLTTKSGAQIKLDETNGYVYLINRDGTAWVQMDQTGNVSIFGATNVSMRAQRDFNIRADRNVNIEAGQNIFLKAAKDTVTSTTTFTYDVNNIPKNKTIPYYKYVGEGAGEGGNIVMQALNNWHSTTKNSAYLTVLENNMELQIGNAYGVTTLNGTQDYQSAQGIKITTDAALDLAATGNIRAGSGGMVSVVGGSDIVLCSNAGVSINAAENIKGVSGSNILLSGMNLGVSSSDMSFNGNLSVAGETKLAGGLRAAAPALLNVSAPFVPAPDANPTAAEKALSARGTQKAEIKPLVEKINILATWKDPESKFKRGAESLNTTVSTLPTYEPCPEHENFTYKSISGYVPKETEAERTYQGSGGAGNDGKTAPAENTTPGANNTDLPVDSPVDNSVTKDMNVDAFKCQLKIHEGVVYKSYNDSVGLLTGGVGHLLRPDEKIRYPLGAPISEDQVNKWLDQDMVLAISGAQRILTIDVWGELSDVRKRACADLCYNLGPNRFAGFKKFIAAMKSGDFNTAGQELRSSRWFTQVGKRGPAVVAMIVQNVDTTGCSIKGAK